MASSRPTLKDIRALYHPLDDDEFEYYTKLRYGKLFIVNNYIFNGEMPNRDFSGLDRDALLQAFRWVGYRHENIQIEDNLTAARMRALAEQAAGELYQKGSSLVFVVLSYGGDGHLFGVDSRSLTFEYLMDPIRESLHLRNIPKIFLFQACKASVNKVRMTSTSSGGGARPPPSHLTTDAQTCGPANHCITYPRSDTLVAYSALPGSANGSMFIQAFAEVLQRDGKKHDITLMLARASRIMSYTPGTSFPNKSLACPVVISQLEKKFFFT
ncbi:caspase-7-like [Watersipora subatra]|uniref:caspase-7-like n=1 Tax=Watersipora subatra TaxID=2589382 RepID=UPI00355B3808